MKAFGSAFFGLFTGLLIGLSSSPVVALIAGALVAILGAVLGIVNKESLKVAASGYVMIGFFSMCACIGVVVGLKIRTGQLWGKDLRAESDKWHEVLQDSALVEKMIIYEHSGLLVDPGMKVDDRPLADATRLNVLFSVTSTAAEKLNPENFQEMDDEYDAWTTEGNPWEQYARAIDKKISEEDQLNAYTVVWTMLKE